MLHTHFVVLALWSCGSFALVTYPSIYILLSYITYKATAPNGAQDDFYSNRLLKQLVAVNLLLLIQN